MPIYLSVVKTLSSKMAIYYGTQINILRRIYTKHIKPLRNDFERNSLVSTTNDFEVQYFLD